VYTIVVSRHDVQERLALTKRVPVCTRRYICIERASPLGSSTSQLTTRAITRDAVFAPPRGEFALATGAFDRGVLLFDGTAHAVPTGAGGFTRPPDDFSRWARVFSLRAAAFSPGGGYFAVCVALLTATRPDIQEVPVMFAFRASAKNPLVGGLENIGGTSPSLAVHLQRRSMTSSREGSLSDARDRSRPRRGSPGDGEGTAPAHEVLSRGRILPGLSHGAPRRRRAAARDGETQHVGTPAAAPSTSAGHAKLSLVQSVSSRSSFDRARDARIFV